GLSLESMELMLPETFSTACAFAQQRVVQQQQPTQEGGGRRQQQRGQEQGGGGRVASCSTGGGRGGVGGGAGGEGEGEGEMPSSVLALHTQDDLEYGMAYARVAEVLPPVTSIRATFGHRAPLPDISIRRLAGTMFRFVRVLCHVNQEELDWVRLPGGVTSASADGLFLPLMPGDPTWNVTDIFRPRHLGFRITFAYTRRNLTLDFSALTLMRSVPMDIRGSERPPAAHAAAAAATTAAPAAADPCAEANGSTTTAGGPHGRQTAAPAAAAPADMGGGGRGGRIRAAPVDHSRSDEFSYWLRNPDVVRMEQVQTFAGKLEAVADAVGGNWRQMPVAPVWWISGWVDRFLRLFLVTAIEGEEEMMKKIQLHNLYDPNIEPPWGTTNNTAAASTAGGKNKKKAKSKGKTSKGATAASQAPASPPPQQGPSSSLSSSSPSPSSSRDAGKLRWDRVEATLLGLVASMTMGGNRSGQEDGFADFSGQQLSEKEMKVMEKGLHSKAGEVIMGMSTSDKNPDRGCIVFTAQWNKLAQAMKWPVRSTLEVQDVLSRMVRMSCCSYWSSWESSVQAMLGLLMSGEVSPALRRETEAKLLSLASDVVFARRLVWGMCRGRRGEARTLALLSGVVEFQPALLEAIRQHEEECQALSKWQEEEHWAVAAGPALLHLTPEQLAGELQHRLVLRTPPLVIPYDTAIGADASLPYNITGEMHAAAAAAVAASEEVAGLTPAAPAAPSSLEEEVTSSTSADAAAAAGDSDPTAGGPATTSTSTPAPPPSAEGGGSNARTHVMFVRFRTRGELRTAVSSPLVTNEEDLTPSAEQLKQQYPQASPQELTKLAARMAAEVRRQRRRSPALLVALLPVSQWEAAAVPAARLPRRDDASALSFFNLVFSRLPRGLQRADPHAAGSLWGCGLPAVLLHRRPAASRWSPWLLEADVGEEAAVVGPLFEAHTTQPLPKTWIGDIDSSGDGVVSYREFLQAYLRHRAGDFGSTPMAEVAPPPAAAAGGAGGAGAAAAAIEVTATATAAPQTAAGAEEEEDSAAAEMSAAAAPDSAPPGPSSDAPAAAAVAAPPPAGLPSTLSGKRGWQRLKAATRSQLSQAFWDRENALRRLRARETEAHAAAQQDALMTAERKGAAGPAAAAAARPLRVLGALGGLVADGPGGPPSPPSTGVLLAGLDCLAAEELSEVQRCAWTVYANLRSAARYLQAAHTEGAISTTPTPTTAPQPTTAPFATSTAAATTTATATISSSPSSSVILTPFQLAERAALDSLLRCVRQPGALFGPGGAGGGAAAGAEAPAAAAEEAAAGGQELQQTQQKELQRAKSSDAATGTAAAVGEGDEGGSGEEEAAKKEVAGPEAAAAGVAAGGEEGVDGGKKKTEEAAAASGRGGDATARPPQPPRAVSLARQGDARSWLRAIAGAAGAGNRTGAQQDASSSAHPRDCALLELLLDLAAATGTGAHADPLAEGQHRPLGPLPGVPPLLQGRTLASAATQVGADAALELTSSVGALALSVASAAAARDGLPSPLGGLDEVFAASALRLAAEEVWAFVTDMQALVDQVLSPLVAAADQSLPIIQRESIKAIFGDTNIELILEYETELLKLLTVHWRSHARTGLLAGSVA
ncbi:hypothetical protein Agub_g14136, partial [Astrephomene gubernaculifera]